MSNAKHTGGKLAPAVGLLLLGDSAWAGIAPPDFDDGASVPEPGMLGLLAIGAVAGGVAYVRHKRRNKK